MSYAGATATEVRPTKNQAIIIDSMDGCTNDDYIDGLETLTDPLNICYISKISGGRVCVYLKSEEIVNSLINKEVQVKGYELKIRPLIERNKRVVISNVNPIIANNIILEALKAKGIIPVSRIVDIKASLSRPNRAHILSFRRQVYVKEEDVNKLPDSLSLQIDNTTYWIYLSTDLTQCFLCKHSGHIAKMCPNINNSQSLPSPQVSDDSITMNTDSNENEIYPAIPEANKPTAPKAPKRHSPPSTLSISSCDSSANPLNQDTADSSPIFKKPVLKKTKIEQSTKEKKLEKINQNSTRVGELLAPAVQQLNKTYALSFEKFQEFIEKSYTETNHSALALTYTNDILGLIQIIREVHPLVDRTLEIKLTHVKKKLRRQHTHELESENDNDSEDIEKSQDELYDTPAQSPTV